MGLWLNIGGDDVERRNFEDRTTLILNTYLLVSTAVVHLREPLATQSTGMLLQAKMDGFVVCFEIGTLS